MADIKYYDVILKPVITEKSMNAMGDKKYTFMVHVDANKSMIKEAVEKMFPGTKVASVNTMNCDGKTKNFKNVLNNLKVNKALVVLSESDENAVLSARNIADVKTAQVGTINVYDILKYNTVVASKAAVASIEEVYA